LARIVTLLARSVISKTQSIWQTVSVIHSNLHSFVSNSSRFIFDQGRVRHIGRALLPLLCGCLFLSGTAAKAAVTITFEQVGADVVASTSGSIAAGWSNGQTAGLGTSTGDTAILSNIAVRAQTGGSRWSAPNNFWTYTATSAPTNFETGTATGDTFGYSSGNNFYTPTGVAEGEAFTPNTTMTWTGQTLDSLFGNNPPYTPTVVFTLDNADTISIVAVPEPATIALVSGVMVIGLVMSRRRNRAV
jgi:hypothetical protein